ncbi:MAG TPA: cytochrome P450 [Anaerolineales bacterium]|nr:cytochrome P450 [Anaerolineales bacterium]
MATSQLMVSKPGSLPPGPKVSLRKMLFSSRGQDRLAGLLNIWKQYGDIVHSRIGPLNNYMLFGPEYVYHVLVTNQKNYVKGPGYNSLRLMLGQGLLTSDGDLWKRQRRLMSPHFTPTAVLDFSDVMAGSVEHHLERWEQAAKQGEPLHTDFKMLQLTMSIIGQALFSLDLGDAPTEVGLALEEAFAFIPTRSFNPLVPMWLPLPSHRRFGHNLKVIDGFIYDQIAEGRRHPERENFLSVMLKVQDAETGQGMSDRQLRDEVITLFFAGFETTARTLTWAWYLLSKHPEVVEKIRSESDQVLKDGRPASSADLERLTYARMVVDETLRLYPPTAVLARQNIEADEIGGYTIPARSLITLSPYAVHRSPQSWPDPERFDPERFSAKNSAGRPKSAYIPFAAGPRVCLGNSFALMEMVYAVSMAAQRFDVRPLVDEEIRGVLGGTIRPEKPVDLLVSPRR